MLAAWHWNSVGTLVAVVAGVLSWTLAEYLLHRFLGHDKRTFPNPFGAEHTRHHADNYFAPSWKKALVALVAVPAIVLAARPLVGGELALVYGVSFVAMYVAYEVVHRRAHTHRGLGAYGRFLRRHHFHHHFGNPRTNHGVTSPLWDLVFGTYEAPRKIRVPEKLRMSWLEDPTTGEVCADLAGDYEIVRRTVASSGGGVIAHGA